ncbi:MAG: hypothetical protein PHH69_00855 [Candidatus Omnitrophica bacterium]|nr:hypothetical protein [Candidatus Omnitrophota bacterium]
MKKRYFLIPAIIVILVLFILYKEKLVFKIARANLKKTLPISKLEIKRIEFNPFTHLLLEGVSIKSPLQKYSIYLASVRADYTLFSILRSTVNKVELIGINVSIEDNVKVNPAKPILNVKEIRASGFVKFRDVEIKNFKAQIFQQEFSRPHLKGSLSAEAVNMKKVKLANLNAAIDVTPESLSVPEFDLTAFKGEIKGKALAKISKPAINFSVDLKGKNVDLAQMDEDLELKEKVEISGLCDFSLLVKGNEGGLTDLSGGLDTHEGGGKFIITDKQALSNLNYAQGVSFDAALESLKNYRYDEGNAKVYIEDGNIVLHMLMDGELGKRDLMVVYHGSLKFNQKF